MVPEDLSYQETLMYTVRQEVRILVDKRNLIESCDIGAAKLHSRCRIVPVLDNAGQKIPALHCYWRQPITCLDLNTEECRLLIVAGYNIIAENDSPMVRAIEKRSRHIHLMFTNGGWCFATADVPTTQGLEPEESMFIPTLDMTLEEQVAVGIHDAFRTLNMSFKIHGVYDCFVPHYERLCDYLKQLASFAYKTLEANQPPRTLSMGKITQTAVAS